eukprot:3224995-Rhodomonas_salina.1
MLTQTAQHRVVRTLAMMKDRTQGLMNAPFSCSRFKFVIMYRRKEPFAVQDYACYVTRSPASPPSLFFCGSEYSSGEGDRFF